MNHSDLYDRMSPAEFEALRRKPKTRAALWFYVFAFLVVALFVLAELFLAPTNEVSAKVERDNAYYCAHLFDYEMRAGDRAKIEELCKNI